MSDQRCPVPSQCVDGPKPHTHSRRPEPERGDVERINLIRARQREVTRGAKTAPGVERTLLREDVTWLIARSIALLQVQSDVARLTRELEEARQGWRSAASACTCGSGGHPRDCTFHGPMAKKLHVLEMNYEAAQEDIQEAEQACARIHRTLGVIASGTCERIKPGARRGEQTCPHQGLGDPLVHPYPYCYPCMARAALSPSEDGREEKVPPHAINCSYRMTSIDPCDCGVARAAQDAAPEKVKLPEPSHRCEDFCAHRSHDWEATLLASPAATPEEPVTIFSSAAEIRKAVRQNKRDGEPAPERIVDQEPFDYRKFLLIADHEFMEDKGHWLLPDTCGALVRCGHPRASHKEPGP